MSCSRQDMTDAERELLRSALPTGCRGLACRNDRRIMDGIFFILPAGSPWRDLPGVTARIRPAARAGARTGAGRGSSRIFNGLPARTEMMRMAGAVPRRCGCTGTAPARAGRVSGAGSGAAAVAWQRRSMLRWTVRGDRLPCGCRRDWRGCRDSLQGKPEGATGVGPGPRCQAQPCGACLRQDQGVPESGNKIREVGRERPVHRAACRDTRPAASSGKGIN